MYPDTSLSSAGYMHGSLSGPLADLAADYSLRTGCAPVFVLSQQVAANPQPDLQTICRRLNHKGIITGTTIHTFSLLVLLSSGQTLQELVSTVLQKAARNDGVVFLEDVYRYSYDPERTFSLIAQLVHAYRNPKVRSPLVLKAPSPSDRNLFHACPELYHNCFHLSEKPAAAVNGPVRQQPKQERPQPPRQQTPAPEATVQPPLQQQASRPVPPQTPPWYQKKPSLLNAEYHGLRKFLHDRNFTFILDEPIVLPYSGRIRINVRLTFRGMGQCTMIIIYDNDFRPKATSCVSSAISGYDRAQLQRRLAGVKNLRDPELNAHLFSPACNPRILAGYGAAAATVDGMIRAMM